MTESGDSQPGTDLASLYERLDAVRAKLKKVSAPFLAGQIGLWQLATVAKPFWDEQEEIKDELHRAFFKGNPWTTLIFSGIFSLAIPARIVNGLNG